jgi:hypothetical protein
VVWNHAAKQRDDDHKRVEEGVAQARRSTNVLPQRDDRGNRRCALLGDGLSQVSEREVLFPDILAVAACARGFAKSFVDFGPLRMQSTLAMAIETKRGNVGAKNIQGVVQMQTPNLCGVGRLAL